MTRISRRSSALTLSVLALGLAACKSTGTSTPNLESSGAPPEIDIRGGGGGANIFYRVNRSDGSVSANIWAPPADVWKTVVVTYNDLGLPVTTIDEQKHKISSTDARAPRKIGGKALRDYFDCGSGITGPRVDSYDVAYTIVTSVTPAAGDSSTISSTIVGSAKDPSGSSTASVNCGTTGRLEKRIAELVKLKLGR
jgi:hypothetical protein